MALGVAPSLGMKEQCEVLRKGGVWGLKELLLYWARHICVRYGVGWDEVGKHHIDILRYLLACIRPYEAL